MGDIGADNGSTHSISSVSPPLACLSFLPDPLRVVPASVCRNPLRCLKKKKGETTRYERTWKENQPPRERGGRGGGWLVWKIRVHRRRNTRSLPCSATGVVDTGSIRGSSSAHAFTSAPLKSSVWRLERGGVGGGARQTQKGGEISLLPSLSLRK